MVKNTNKKRKRTNHALFHAVKARMKGEVPSVNVVAVEETPLANPDDNAVALDDNGNVMISDSDLNTTVKTLELLVANPSLFHSKQCKNLRRTLHPLVVEQLKSYDKGVDYRHKVTHALQYQHWSDALAALQACCDFQQYPKQGTVQRWVRDCTAAGACQMKLLQAILNLSTSSHAQVGDGNKHDPALAWATHLANHPDSKDDLVIMEGWKWWDTTAEDKDNDNETLPFTTTDIAPITVESRIVYREVAAERTPPNHHDLLLHATSPGLVQWNTTPLASAMHPIPFLPPPSRVLSNVLAPDECQQLLQITTALGFRQDHPVSLAQPTGIDSCEWMVDESILDTLFQRVKSLLPTTLTIGGGKSNSKTVQLHGINPRWRCFRYGQDCVYRPHLDGSWPLCYMHNDTYICPQSQQQSQQSQSHAVIKSYLTFLIYLNDDFQGGETRFYLPQGVARGIVPKAGSVTVFPQGNLASLIHEGSLVTQGTKYVIRTDVLYRPVLGGTGGNEDEDENDEEQEHVVMENHNDDDDDNDDES